MATHQRRGTAGRPGQDNSLGGDHELDPRPYELELQAVDACRPDDVLVAAAAGSTRSGIWGELLSTAAANRGCAGALVDGAVRDTAQMNAMGFSTFARGTCPRDSLHRQRVTAVDVTVSIGGVRIEAGDLVFADADGVVVVPRAVEQAALAKAWDKVTRRESRPRRDSSRRERRWKFFASMESFDARRDHRPATRVEHVFVVRPPRWPTSSRARC